MAKRVIITTLLALALAACGARALPTTETTGTTRAVAGGAEKAAPAVASARLQTSAAPDGSRGDAGQEQISIYVVAGQLQGLDALYDEQGRRDVTAETFVPLISPDGELQSVPVNIYRANVLWYNPALLEEVGVEVPTTWEEFFAVCEAIEAAGKICLSMGEQWTAMHLMETVLLGALGPEGYNGLWDGTMSWDSAEATEALATYRRVVEHTNEDAETLSWQDAARLVATGDAAFNVMGEWAGRYFSGSTESGNLGLTPTEDYGWMPVPGTDGIFQFLSSHREETAAYCW